MSGGPLVSSSGHRWIRALLAATATACAFLAAAPAAGALETTLGSKLEDAYETTFGGAAITAYQEAAPSETLLAPGPGTITSWSVRSGDSGAEYELRILRPAAGGELTAVGTSTAHSVPNSNNEVRGPFAVSLSVKAGDLIALHVIKGQGAPINNVAAPAADELNYLEDPFANGITKKPVLEPLHGGSQELLVSADFKAGGPVNTALPQIAGEPQVGSPLTATEGSWEGASTFAYQWLRCLGASCEPIAGATSSTYTPTSTDEGKQIAVVVTATGEGGKTSAQSAATDGVKPGAAPPPANTALPQVSGEARETETLTGTIGSWAGGPTSFAEQWMRCATASGTNCSPIPGASSLTYVPVRADVGSTLRLRVTATNGVGPTSAESAPTKIVQPLVIKAILTASPAVYFCTGNPVEFNGSASKTPNPPIVSYRFTYIEFPIQAGLLILGGPGALEEFLSKLPVKELASGPNPILTQTFTWNKIATEEETNGPYVGQPWRDPVQVTMTVTDLAGGKSSASVTLIPAQTSAIEPRTKCPKTTLVRFLPSVIAGHINVLLSGSSVATTMTCKSAVPCAGSVSVLAARGPLAVRASGAKAKRKPTILARPTFFSIRQRHKATIRAPLTRTGHALLKRGHPVHAIVQLTSVTPAGARSTRSIHVTLTRR